MNEKTLKKLEYDKIIKKLMDFAVSPMAKEKAEALLPYTAMTDIIQQQQETSEAVSMILRKGTLTLGGFKEIRPQMKRAAMGGVLSMGELMHIGSFLYVCRRAKEYAKHENKTEVYEKLDALFELIQPIVSLENEITRCIVSETEMADTASSALHKIRREIKQSHERVKDQLNHIILSSAYKNMLQDPVVTIRNDRYCVPVKSEYRSTFPGMLHDQSNTGSTVFMEPLSVVQLNNKIKELQEEEKKEIEKILSELSQKVTEQKEILEANMEVLVHLDFVFAKGNLSLSMNGTQPLFNVKGYINIQKARHPLLEEKRWCLFPFIWERILQHCLLQAPTQEEKQWH